MNSFVRHLLLLLPFIACENESMSMDELRNTRWSVLENGMEYISLNDSKVKSGDSIQLSTKGYWGSNITLPEEVYNEVHPILVTGVLPILEYKLPNSNHGYLKINLYRLINRDTLTAMIYIDDDIDSRELNKYMKMLQSMHGIFKASYISKDMAKTKYLENGNEDWTGILESNPLPASIEIKFNERLIPREKFETLKSQIKDGSLWVREVSFVPALFEKSRDSYYILEYTRR